MIFELVTELAEYLESSLAELYQRTSQGTTDLSDWAVPQIHIGALPQTDPPDQDAHPYVVVRPETGRDRFRNYSKAKIKLKCGAFTAETGAEAGYNEILNIVCRVRQVLLSLPAGILSNRYELKTGTKWWIGDEDHETSHPLYTAWVETTWFIPAPPRVPSDEEIDILGSGIE